MGSIISIGANAYHGMSAAFLSAINYYPQNNAASITTEADATTGWTAGITGTITSDAAFPDTGSYALKVVPTGANGRAYYDLDAILTHGSTYTLAMAARHLGSGGDWQIGLGATDSSTAGQFITTLDNTETTYQNLSAEFTHSASTRYLVVRENNVGNDGGAYVDSISLSKNSTPWLWVTRSGAGQSLMSTEWQWELGTQYNDILYFIAYDASGNRHCFKYEAGAITQLTTSTGFTAAGVTAGDGCYMLFADSNGNLYASFYSASRTYGLWRSTDGITWTENVDVVLSAASAEFDNGAYVQTMDESSTGTLICAAYSNGVGVEGKGLWRSTNAGVNWTNITADLDFGTGVQREHVHNVAYDRYRDAWFVTLGDKGANAFINYSTSDGATGTWSTWSGSFQCIGMAFNSTGMYFTAENGTDSSIYKATTVGGTLTAVKALSTTANGWCRFGWEDSANGIVAFVYSATGIDPQIYVTDDDGTTWSDLMPSGTGSTNWGKRFSKSSDYATKRGSELFHYQGGLMFKVFNAYTPIEINEGTGGDYILNPNGPWSEIPDYGGLTSSSTLKLTANYAAPFINYGGETIDLNGFAFTYSTTATLSIDEDFEPYSGTLTLSTNGTAADTASTEQANSPTRSIKLINDGTYSEIRHNSAFTGIVSGEQAYLHGYYYYDSASAPASDVTIAYVRNAFTLKYAATGTGVGSLYATVTAISRNLRQLQNPVQLVLKQGWNEIKVDCLYHATQGHLKIYLNGEPSVVAQGINTSGAWDRAGFAQTSGGTENGYWDDIKASKNDPENP